MLEDYLRLYEQQADKIPGWRKMNKNALCNAYIENEQDKDLQEAYLSAIIARYWPAATRMCQCNKFGVDEIDCYHWLIDSVLYALEHRSWLDESSNLFGDPNGPDKVINRCLKSQRLTHYQLLNKDKRVANLNTISIDCAEEDMGDYAQDSLGLVEDADFSILSAAVSKMIVGCVKQSDYFTALLLHFILNRDVFEYEESEKSVLNMTLLSKRKLVHVFSSMTLSDIQTFLTQYDLDTSQAPDLLQYIKSISAKRFDVLLARSLSSLRTSKMRKLICK